MKSKYLKIFLVILIFYCAFGILSSIIQLAEYLTNSASANRNPFLLIIPFIYAFFAEMIMFIVTLIAISKTLKLKIKAKNVLIFMLGIIILYLGLIFFNSLNVTVYIFGIKYIHIIYKGILTLIAIIAIIIAIKKLNSKEVSNEFTNQT